MKILLLVSAIIAASNGCEFYRTSGATQDEAAAATDKHNELRKQIANGQVAGQPRGVNLLRFYWDDYLAAAAQNISNSCIFGHQPVNDDRFSVGQNIYQWSISVDQGSDPDWESAVLAWFNEYEGYTFSNTDYDHYTQVVWATTQYVGCGYTYYLDNEGAWYNKYYVCNYGPAGNVVGSYPYETGDSGCEDLC